MPILGGKKVINRLRGILESDLPTENLEISQIAPPGANTIINLIMNFLYKANQKRIANGNQSLIRDNYIYLSVSPACEFF